MEKINIWFELSGGFSDIEYIREQDIHCTNLYRSIPANVNLSRTPLNKTFIRRWTKEINIKSNSKDRPWRFVSGDMILCDEIFHESSDRYNRRRDDDDRKRTYYEDCRDRYETTKRQAEVHPKNSAIRKSYSKRIFYISRHLRIIFKSPKDENLDNLKITSIAEEFVKWFVEKFQFMKVYFAEIQFDNKTLNCLPTLEIGFIPIAKNTRKNSKRKLKIGWNSCLQQSFPETTKREVFKTWRKVCINKLHEIACKYDYGIKYHS